MCVRSHIPAVIVDRANVKVQARHPAVLVKIVLSLLRNPPKEGIVSLDRRIQFHYKG